MPDYPMYFGYFFREIYRDSVKQIASNQETSAEQKEKLDKEIESFAIENELFIPEMSTFQIENHKKHVLQSLQNVSYNHGIEFVRNKNKVTLPHTNMKKLAIFDMDETLMHTLSPDLLKINPKLKITADVVLNINKNKISN